MADSEGTGSRSQTKPELFIGLVGAVGADLEAVVKAIKRALDRHAYECREVHLIEALHEFKRWKSIHHRFEDTRISEHMDAGNEFRKRTGRNDALAVLGMVDIQERHRRVNSEEKEPYGIVPGWANVFRSLKHPDEVRTLRRVYGDSFSLIAVYSPRDKRIQSLVRKIAKSRGAAKLDTYRGSAEELNGRDEAETDLPYGQNVRDTFAMADAFVQADSPGEIEADVGRIIELMFGHKYHTPRPEEYGMFHAQAAALRSASLARQVGAAITTPDGDVIALGTNEVPKSGGGMYWDGDEPDHRDFTRGFDVSDERRRDNLQEVLTRLTEAGWLKKSKAEMDVDDRLNEGLVLMRDSQLMGAIEYGRCVHAEMAAILDAARRGVKLDECVLYTTTFPCHDCARHIIPSGIRKVVYIEPYAKSLAPEFHDDAIAVDEESPGNRVSFKPFIGIGPRFYSSLFSAGERKDEAGKAFDWDPKSAVPRRSEQPAVYLRNETEEVASLSELLDSKGLSFAA